MQDGNLELIKFPEHRSLSAVPSWSWMAFTLEVSIISNQILERPIGNTWRRLGLVEVLL